MSARRLLVQVLLVTLTVSGCTSPDQVPTGESTATSGSTAEATGDSAASEGSDPAATGEPSGDATADPEPVLTAPGSDLEFGDGAQVVFEPDRKRSTVLKLKVTGARRASPRDFRNFILDDPYKRKASYYYVRVRVKNIGEGDVGGAPVPLWGVNGDNTLLPAVGFTTSFRPCASTPLPEKFKPGEKVRTCLVFLSPEKGSLEAVSFRPDQAFDPIEWTGTVKAAKGDGKRKKGDR